MMTWKVWADAPNPLFEGDEAQARAYVVEQLSDSRDAILESPDGDSYAYQDGVWLSLDSGAVPTRRPSGVAGFITSFGLAGGRTSNDRQYRRCTWLSIRPASFGSARAWLRCRYCLPA